MNQRLPVTDVIVRPGLYRVCYEQFGPDTLVHVDVHRWSHVVARQFRRDIDAAQALLGRNVYAPDNPASKTLHHFLSLHGFKPCGSVFNQDRTEVAMFGRSFDGQPLAHWRPA